MARLNEPPIAPAPVTETVGADELVSVKRRFLRQNRELAKTNSQQSIRIRALENDASRLLAENLSLREQVLQLQNALEAQSHRPSLENINAMKNRLESKIQEFGILVAELGQLKTQDDGLPRCKSQTAATRRSPDERQWRSGLGLQEVENAMLPTIAEGKFYPRRTMNADELRHMLDDPESQSPDIGPPPVSRFESEEPIAFNPSLSLEEQPVQPAEDTEPVLPSNLETRRRRRESGGPKPNIRRVSLFESPPEESDEVTAKPIRTGAKRKFSVQEDEEKVKPQPEPFRFSRRNIPASENSQPSEQPRSKSPERPVLNSKPVNTDPVLSPKKQRSSANDKLEKKPLAKSSRARLTITRNVQIELPSPIEMPEPIPTTDIILDSLPPKTPAPDDVFSPPSTEPSTSRPESKDTPPPGDFTSLNQTGIGGRPSRRVRAQVSYKEPSLNTKMRRPGKELVDAVQSDQGRRASVEPQVAPLTAGRATIKQEPGDSSWKPMGALGGRSGEEDGELGSPLRQKLDRREGSQEGRSDPPKLNSVAASNAISALIEETSTAKRKPYSTNALSTKATLELPASKPLQANKDDKAPAAKQGQNPELDIFEFNESSPSATDAVASAISSHPRIDLAKTARTARRHSSVPAPPSNEERRIDSSAKQDGALPIVYKKAGSGGVRTESTASLGRSMAGTRVTVKEKEKKVNGGLPTSASSIHLGAKAEGDARTSTLRAERAASRRKSMMI